MLGRSAAFNGWMSGDRPRTAAKSSTERAGVGNSVVMGELRSRSIDAGSNECGFGVPIVAQPLGRVKQCWRGLAIENEGEEEDDVPARSR